MKICVSGSKGRMGSRIVELAKDDPALEVAGSFDIGDDAEAALSPCDCLIEFTSPQATIGNLSICERLGKAMVIGTTGLSDADKETVKAAAKKIAVVMSPNMSVGVNLLFRMIAEAARTLGAGYGAEIIEAHHSGKKDAPSGTAKEMARIVKDATGADAPIESIREGDIVGEHTITFDGDADTFEITHSAKTRDIFAKGALVAAKFLEGKKHGLFTMRDVLGL
jgi:4-hydroxy-tetrahydrodipicolinate reductase